MRILHLLMIGWSGRCGDEKCQVFGGAGCQRWAGCIMRCAGWTDACISHAHADSRTGHAHAGSPYADSRTAHADTGTSHADSRTGHADACTGHSNADRRDHTGGPD